MRSGYLTVGAALLATTALGGCASADRYPSPDGAVIVVVEERLDMIDTVWKVSVRSSRPFADEALLGCLSDDLGPVVTNVRWDTTRSFTIETGLGGGSGIQVEVNDRGEPINAWPDEIFRVCN